MFNLLSSLPVTRAVLALSLVSLMVMMGSSMATPSLALYAGGFSGANEFMIGAVIAGFAIGRLLFDVPAGFLADRAGASRTMMLGLAVLVGSSIAAAAASGYWILLSARVLEGIGSSIYVTAAITFVLMASDSSKRGMTMATYQSILMTGPIVGPVAGAPVAAYFGLNAPYYAFAAMMAASMGVVWYLAHRGVFSTHKHRTAQAAGSTSTGRLSLYLNAAGIATFGFAFLRSGIYSTGMPLFAYGSLGLSVFDVGIILTGASLANLASSYISGRLTQMFGMRRPLFGAILLSAALVASIPFANSFLALLALMAMMGVSSGFFGQSIAWAAEQIESKARRLESASPSERRPALALQSHVTRGIGINRMIGDIGLILGPLFVGYIVSQFSGSAYTWVISFGITSGVLAATAACLIRPRLRLRRAPSLFKL